MDRWIKISGKPKVNWRREIKKFVNGVFNEFNRVENRGFSVINGYYGVMAYGFIKWFFSDFNFTCEKIV